MTILSIDWDYVTGDCADGSHGCCGWCTPSPSKLSRGSNKLVAAGWITRLEMLRRLIPVVEGRLWVAECHADILRIVTPTQNDTIIHLDSHLDDADWFGLSCGSWRTFLPSGTNVEIPTTIGEFIDVFICLSSPWTPLSMDGFFWNLVTHFSKTMGSDPEFIGHRRMVLMRAWAQREKQQETEQREGI
jgi:hypothetical protein